ncbi:MAG: hypothetical protein HYS86_03380 [Candidatus Chisholmbacteria bacterium]|nr:hypothetical protein [Candidatus Chisholmbacteria bacterium]
MIVPLEQMVDSVRVALRTAGVWTRKARPDFIHLLSAAEVGAGLRELARQAEEGPGYSNAWAMRLTEALIRTQVLPALGELAGGIGPEAFGFGVPREEGF